MLNRQKIIKTRKQFEKLKKKILQVFDKKNRSLHLNHFLFHQNVAMTSGIITNNLKDRKNILIVIFIYIFGTMNPE
jgi:hypothetical protein